MKFSIIVPVYKDGQYLSECIESILFQSCRDFELLLIDDGSPDRCPQICDDYAEADCRIRVIHQSNNGLSEARNTGISAAEGDYVVFVDIDDVLCAEALQCVAQFVSSSLGLAKIRYPWVRLILHYPSNIWKQIRCSMKVLYEKKYWRNQYHHPVLQCAKTY